jgi:hypothetical protein
LVKRLLTDFGLWDLVQLDENPFRIGGVERISGKQDHQKHWIKHLRAALKRPNVGGVLIVLDGDAKSWEGQPFCAARAAQTLANRAKETGAGTTYSLGFVFACREYETWFLAGIESLAGKRLPDGRPGVQADPPKWDGDLEKEPRGAKEALRKTMPNGYKETLDQVELTRLLDLNQVRQRGLKSFARLEKAIKQLADACKTGTHVATPPSPSS